MLNAIEQRDRPQPRREPCVEAVAFLLQVLSLDVGVLCLSKFQSLLGCFCYHVVLLAIVVEVVGWDAMTPPKLTADTPVLDVLQPMAIGVLILLRVEFDVIIHYWRKGDVSKVLHLEEPLCREFWLDRHIGALRESHLIIIIFDLLHETGILKVDGNLLAHIHTILTYVHASSLADSSIVIEDVDGLQTMLQTESVVVDVVCRSYFQTTCTKLNVNVGVLDDRNLTVNERYDDVLALQPCILLVLWVDTHSRVTHDGLRTGSSYNSVIALVVLVHHVAFLYLLTILLYYVILQVVKFGVLILVDNLLIRKCSLCLRIPVDHTYATINQSLVIKVAEYVDDGTGTSLVHGERSAVPVAASTEAAQLLEDDATMLVSPVPSMLQEFLTSEVSLLDALLSEAIYHLSLSCDAGVVCARNPTSVLALHASATNEDVLDCIVEHVTHVEHTSHIRWRNNHRIRFTTIWLRTEKFVV